ncbi:MAG: PatA/PatG family cyanobactin maturation protease, partial [Spirulinaceae cyanobacterium]
TNNLNQTESANVIPANNSESVTATSSNTPVPMQIANNGMAVMPSNNGMISMPYQVVAVPAMGNNQMAVVPSVAATSNAVVNSGTCGCQNGVVTSNATPNEIVDSFVYAIGLIGYDFGTEARRDSFKQLMPEYTPEDSEQENLVLPANPYDARQMARYLEENRDEAKSLIWTLNLDLTPIYAIEPQGAFASDVYGQLQDFLAGQVKAEDDDEYIERTSIPAILTGRTVTLFSGEVVPVIRPINTRGMYAWQINQLIDSVIAVTQQRSEQEGLTSPSDEVIEEIKYSLRSFLERVYYDLRNLGQTSQERALNFAATNIFQYADALVQVLRNKKRPSETGETLTAVTMQLDSFQTERSPFCRKDSDCWDVKLKFFDPENARRARRVIRYTLDVSDVMPVTLGKVRIWDEAS